MIKDQVCYPDHMRKTHVQPGQQFGRWTVVTPDVRSGRRWGARCLCTCGTERVVTLSNLTLGLSVSCGCWKRDHPSRYKHGIGNDDYRYRLWSSIKKRCYCKTNRAYPDYGGRGIVMHAPWITDFARFADELIAEIGSRPDGYTLDRIDNDGNYEPGNIRWATYAEQNNNRRMRRMYRKSA